MTRKYQSHSEVMLYEHPIGIYVTDAKNICTNDYDYARWENAPGKESFIPILDHISINVNDNVRFATNENGPGADVVTFNTSDATKVPEDAVMRRKKIDIRRNDLFLGETTLVLNFTKKPVTVVDWLGVPKIFDVIRSDRFAMYKGQLVFIYVRSMNGPRAFGHILDNSNYLTKTLEALPGHDEHKEKDIRNLCSYVNSFVTSKKDFNSACGETTIKVATAATIPESELITSDNRKGVFVRNKQIIIRYGVNDVPIVHPRYEGGDVDQQQFIEKMRDFGVSCYIVDNRDELEPRYINFAGQVSEIPKIKDLNQPEGLYIVSINKEAPLTTDNVIKLNEIDSSPYVYKSKEAARTGADLRAQYAEKMEKLRQELAYDAQQQKLEFDRKEEELRSEQRRRENEYREEQRRKEHEFQELQRSREADFKEEQRRRDAEHESAVKTLTRRLEEYKTDSHYKKAIVDEESMYRKNRYEEEKYRRDHTLETVKTISAYAAVAVAGIALYSKFSK